MAGNLFTLSIVYVHIFFWIFVYDALCLRFGQASCAIEMSIINHILTTSPLL